MNTKQPWNESINEQIDEIKEVIEDKETQSNVQQDVTSSQDNLQIKNEEKISIWQRIRNGIESVFNSIKNFFTPKNKKETTKREYLKKRMIDGKVVATKEIFEPKAAGPLEGKTIIVNAGHGYTNRTDGVELDCGNQCKETEFDDEWLINYDNAMRLIERLQNQGAKVIYLQGYEGKHSKGWDLISQELNKDENKADMFISIHANSSPKPPEADRAEIFYHPNSDRNFGKRLANIFEEKLDNYQDNKNYARSKEADLSVLRTSDSIKMPAILWEVAFMNRPEGRERMSNPKTMEEYSDMLTEAITDYYTNSPDTRKRYIVSNKDTLGKIANNYGVAVEDLKAVNGLKSDEIRIGQELIIPDMKI